MKTMFRKGNRQSAPEELTPEQALAKTKLLAETAGKDVTIIAFDELRRQYIKQKVVTPKGDVRELPLVIG